MAKSGLGLPLTSNTTEFVAKQVHRARQRKHRKPLTRSSLADVFQLGGREGAGVEVKGEGNRNEASPLKPGTRRHLLDGREGPPLVPGRHYHCSIQVSQDPSYSHTSVSKNTLVKKSPIAYSQLPTENI